jgi:ribosome-associated translation inhibitor RaiA
MKIVFKNLEHSDLVKKIVEDRFESLAGKFPQLRSHKMIITLEMENSPVKAGKDSFSARVLIDGRKYRGLSFTRTSSNLYVAVAEAVDGMLELLNRAGERYRVRSRRQTRKVKQQQLLQAAA